MHRSRPWIALTLLLTACTPQATQPTVPPSEAPLQRLSDQTFDIAGGTVNVDLNQQATVRYNLRAIPSVLFFQDSEELLDDRIVGPVPASTLHRRIEMFLK